MAVVVVRECFGGTGNYIVHPAIFGRVFLDAVFPVSAGSPVLFRCAAELPVFAAIVLSAVFFLAQRRIYFETLFYYITIYLLAAFMLGGGSKILMHAGVAVFTAFFLVTDPVVLPLTRQGTNVFALLAAFFAGVLGLWYPAVTAVCYSILIMNMFVPWINDRMRPGSRRGI
jgi:electron transport complex protein RnfD